MAKAPLNVIESGTSQMFQVQLSFSNDFNGIK